MFHKFKKDKRTHKYDEKRNGRYKNTQWNF